MNNILDPNSIKTGDLIFFTSNDFESEIIKRTTNSIWCHIGICVWIRDDILEHLVILLKNIPRNIDFLVDKIYNLYFKKNVNPYDDKMFDEKQIIRYVIVYLIIHNDKILEDYLFSVEDTKNSKSDVKEQLYMWESTKANQADDICCLSGTKDVGVKLTKFCDRTNGYPLSYIGKRSVNVDYLFKNNNDMNLLSGVEYVKKIIFMSFISSFIINSGKKYEKNYEELIYAWSYDNRPFDIEYGDTYYFLNCIKCNFFNTLYSPYYHSPNEDKYLFCSELAMEICDSYYVNQSISHFMTEYFSRNKGSKIENFINIKKNVDIHCHMEDNNTLANNIFLEFTLNAYFEDVEWRNTRINLCSIFCHMKDLDKSALNKNESYMLDLECGSMSKKFFFMNYHFKRYSVSPEHLAKKKFSLYFPLKNMELYSGLENIYYGDLETICCDQN